ncbi:hypothetical protein IAT38_007841 [Cryptococcus sp. DSM 104549]
MTRTIKFSDGKVIPAIGWGNGSGGIGKNASVALEAGVAALKAGIRHIDTAQIYLTEEATGQAIREVGLKPADVWVTSKVGGSLEVTPEAVKASVQSTLDKLGFKPNLLLIHNPFVPEGTKVAELWTRLEDLVLDGTLEGVSLGVSNFRPQDLEAVLAVARIKPVVNQLEYHPYVLSHLAPVLAIHAKHGITVESYGPLTPLLRHPTGGPLKPVLERIAERLSKEAGRKVDPTEVLLLWTVQNGAVAVTTSKNPERIKGLVEVDALPDLTAEEVKEIEEVGKKVHYRHYKEHMTEDFPSPNLPDGTS